MPAPRTYDEEIRARAVRMYFDRITDLKKLKLTGRRAVGDVLDINPATLRNIRASVNANDVYCDPASVMDQAGGGERGVAPAAGEQCLFQACW